MTTARLLLLTGVAGGMLWAASATAQSQVAVPKPLASSTPQATMVIGGDNTLARNDDPAISKGGPPPPPRKESAPFASAVSDVQKAKSMLVDGSEAAMRAAGQSVNDADLLKGGKVLKGMGIAADVGKVTEAYIRGGQPAMAEKIMAVGIDQCIDRAVDVGCAALGTSTLMGAPATYAACKVVASAALFVAEKCTDGSIGDHVASWARKSAEGDPSPPASTIDSKRARMKDRMSQMQTNNQNSIEQQQAMVSQSPTGGYDSGADVSAFLNVLNQGMQTHAPPMTPVSAGPTGCHPGHNESAHPGGCSDYGNTGN